MKYKILIYEEFLAFSKIKKEIKNILKKEKKYKKNLRKRLKKLDSKSHEETHTHKNPKSKSPFPCFCIPVKQSPIRSCPNLWASRIFLALVLASLNGDPLGGDVWRLSRVFRFRSKKRPQLIWNLVVEVFRENLSNGWT